MSLIPSDSISISSDDENDSDYFYEAIDGVVIILHKQLPCYLHGVFTLSVLIGEIEINGYKLTPLNSPQNLYSVGTHFNLKRLQGGMDNDFDVLEEYLLNKSDVYNARRVLADGDAVIYCVALNNKMMTCLNKHVSEKFFPSIDQYLICFDKEFEKYVVQNRPLVVHNDWEQIDYKNIEFRGLLCGNKLSGRSTLLRYMVNRLLNNHGKVCFVELDFSKPEFSMPHCISVYVIETPLLGPEITHIQDSKRSIIMKSPRDFDPLHYLKCVEELLSYADMFSEYPMLINCPVLAHNSEVLSTIIGHSMPNVVIQNMSFNNEVSEVIDLRPHKVQDRIRSGLLLKQEIIPFDYEYLKFCLPITEVVTSELDCDMVWKMYTVAYFSSICDWNGILDNFLQLFRIALADVIVLDNQFTKLDGWQKVACVNGNLVALCIQSSKEDLYDVIGWGIVRSIFDGIAYILTPLEFNLIKPVTHFIVGYQSIPTSMLLHQDFRQMPYLNSSILELP